MCVCMMLRLFLDNSRRKWRMILILAIQMYHDERKVYKIIVKVAGRTQVVEKRFKEFHSFHRKLKKSVALDIPDFPPKKVLQLSARALEQRRQGLENYFNAIIATGSIPKSLLTFLTVQNLNRSYDSLDELGTDSGSVSSHQPILTFKEDPYLNPPDDKQDILVEGVLHGLYDHYPVEPENSSSSS